MAADRPSRISVIVPCYNRADLLADTLYSIRAQTRVPDEVLVVDDASTDGSAAVAESLGVRVVRARANRGSAAARNLGVSLTSGDLIAFVDADDTWEPTHLEEIAAIARRVPDAGVYFTGAKSSLGDPLSQTTAYVANEALDLLYSLPAFNPICHSGVAIRRDDFSRVGGYDETMRVCEDIDLWLRLSVRSRFARTPATTVVYRVHPGQISNRRSDMLLGRWRAREKWLATVLRSPRMDHARASEVIRGVFLVDADEVLHCRDSTGTAFMLELCSRIPNGQMLRRRLQWMRAATAALDAMPLSLRDAARTLRRAVRTGGSGIVRGDPPA